MEKSYITLIKEGNVEVKAEVIFTYYSEQFKKNYVVFQPEDSEEVAAASYVEGPNGSGSLNAIETDEEWELIEDLLEDYVKTHEEE